MKISHRNAPSGFDTFTHLSFPVAGPKGLFLSSFPTLSPQSITQIISVKKFASKKKKDLYPEAVKETWHTIQTVMKQETWCLSTIMSHKL